MGPKQKSLQLMREIRTVAWWRAHKVMIAPWVAILLAVLASAGVYFTNDAFRAEIDYALALVKSGDQAMIRDYLMGFGAWAPVISVLLMIAQALIVGIPASFVMFANGVAFGTSNGAVINIIGRLAGATISFSIARMLGKGAVEKMVGRITHADRFERWMQRRGGWAVFASRAVPGMPSDMLSYVAGFTNVSWRTYLMATLFGFLPQSIVFAWFGAEATSWFWVIMMSGTILTGVLALIAVVTQWIRRRMRRTRPAPAVSLPRMTVPAASASPAGRWNAPVERKPVPVPARSYARSRETWPQDVRSGR
jgi:uncharacterized membrane protein YdjX (TVP38/TMEM64 family)